MDAPKNVLRMCFKCIDKNVEKVLDYLKKKCQEYVKKVLTMCQESIEDGLKNMLKIH